jgi:phosphoribosyl 1,2-cyclic phosphate phosphodiesterase
VRLTFLGCGTSVGVPAIGCDCAVCRSGKARNQRLRASVHLSVGGRSLLIDTSPDLRQQALRAAIDRIDAVLYTHAHADHCLGLDDLRIYNFRQKGAIPLYGSERTLGDLKKTFWYCFDELMYPGSRPSIELNVVPPAPFEAAGVKVTPVPLFQAKLPIYAYRIGDFCYITDCSRVPEESWPLLAGLKLLVVNALRYEPHPTHFSVSQALDFIAKAAPARALLTHMNHELDYDALCAELPDHVRPAFDGMVVEMEEPPAGG